MMMPASGRINSRVSAELVRSTGLLFALRKTGLFSRRVWESMRLMLFMSALLTLVTACSTMQVVPTPRERAELMQVRLSCRGAGLGGGAAKGSIGSGQFAVTCGRGQSMAQTEVFVGNEPSFEISLFMETEGEAVTCGPVVGDILPPSLHCARGSDAVILDFRGKP